MKSNAEFDIVVHGATGFTGRLVAEHLARVARDRGVTFAISGRNDEKLKQVSRELGVGDLTIIRADATDQASVEAMVERTHAVITTAGPFQLYGEPIVKACAQSGTDYLDLSGEVAWMRQMIDGYGEAARASGARILHSSGFDSIPSELGVLFLQNEAMRRFGKPARRVSGRITAFRGSYSGGTIAAGAETAAAAGRDPALAALLKDPFALTPGFTGAQQPSDEQAPVFDDDLGLWTAPFPLSTINTRNVHRSNFLQGQHYGTDFTYDERIATGPGDGGKQAAAQMMAMVDRTASPDAPKPGEGPSRAERDAGFYDILFTGYVDDGGRLQVKVHGDRDPGYGSTSKIISETAIFLLQHGSDVPPGVWTPGAALGTPLAAWLYDHAGLSFEVVEGASA